MRPRNCASRPHAGIQANTRKICRANRTRGRFTRVKTSAPAVNGWNPLVYGARSPGSGTVVWQGTLTLRRRVS